MATREETQVIVDLVIKQSEAIKALTDLQKEYDETKQALKELDTTTEAGAAQAEVYASQLRVLNSEMRGQRGVIDNTIRAMEAEGGSLDELKAKLSILRREYNAMSEADRESTKR